MMSSLVAIDLPPYHILSAKVEYVKGDWVICGDVYINDVALHGNLKKRMHTFIYNYIENEDE